MTGTGGLGTGAVPSICVVVSAYNRSSLLPELVRALRAQEYDDFEVILVDNGSTDDTYEVLRSITGDDLRFRVLKVSENAGPARARNKAWRATSAPLVAFTDDDCAPEPTWLGALAEASSRADIVQGCTIWAERSTSQKPRWFDRAQTITQWSGRFETCNLLLPRALLERLDGFDEQFPIAMGEDTDFGLRALAAGATTAFADDAVVRHHIWSSSFGDFLRHRRRYSEVVQLAKINPAARQLLRWRFVVRDIHVLQWLLVPATPLSIWLGAWWFTPAVMMLWSLQIAYRSRRRPFSAPRRLLFSLMQFVGYGYETYCFAVASVRYRTLVI